MRTSVCVWMTAPALAIGILLTAPVAAQETTTDIPEPPVAAAPEQEDDTVQVSSAYSLHARVVGGGRELWSGHLAMTPYGRARVHTDVQEMDSNCPIRNNRFAAKRSTVELTIRPGRREGEALYGVELSWTRPAVACADQGTRAVGFDIEVELVDNVPRVIEGEGGLRLELTRQP